MPALDNNSGKSSDKCVSSETKPTNIFYVWYMELCRRQNTNPICAIRTSNHHRNNQILDFTADRIKMDDWHPIINALRLDLSLHIVSIHSRLTAHKFLDDIDTEEKVKRMKKWFGTIRTKYVVGNLLKALGNMVRRSAVLTYLELDGLHVTPGEHLQVILKMLVLNTSLKYVSFKCCPIGDDGCNEICNVLHTLPNVQILNLSGCGLTPLGAQHLSKLIKYQQINRYSESWHTSLRYEDPVVNNMAGLKRITINNNPKIGDEGLSFILNELDDDLWIKALDMQRCNISEDIAPSIFNMIEYNRSLQVADFRQNNLRAVTVDRILNQLKSKQTNDADEYHWCYTTTSINSTVPPNDISFYTCTTTTNSYRSTSSKNNSKDCKSTNNNKIQIATIKQSNSNNNSSSSDGKINENDDKQTNNNSLLIKAKEQLIELYEQLKEEVSKRQDAEQKCVELKKQVDELLKQQTNESILKEFSNMKEHITQFITFVKENGNNGQQPINTIENALNDLAKAYEIQSSNNDNNQDNKLLIFDLFENVLDKYQTNSMRSDFSITSLSSEEEEEKEIENSSPASTDSESVETLKQMLEELTKNSDL